MKITFVMPIVSRNGGCRVVAIYARKLLALGHDVTVVARVPRPVAPLRATIRRLRGRKVARSDADHDRFFRDLGARFVEIDRAGPLLPEDVPDADVIIATWWRTAFEVASMPRSKGQKAYFVQGHEVHSHLPWDLSGGSYHLPLKKITISSHLRETLAETYGDRDVAVVENSVDTDHFDARARARNAHPTVGFLFADNPLKGTDQALKVLALLQERLPDLHAVSFGKVRPGADRALPPAFRFQQLPRQEDIPGLYAACDVWFCASRSEGFHLPLLEAMACRTPVVTTRIGGAVEAVSEGVTGHIVDIDDTAAMVDRLEAVLTGPAEDWQAMSDAAYERAHRYSWDDAARAFEDALKQLIAAP